jgi:nucleoside-diphosphate-sugar epimerase
VKVVVTGDKGFLGRHYTKAMRDRRFDVTGVDIKDGKDCRTFFAEDKTRWDLAIHCAAVVGGRETIDGNPLALAGNLGMDAAYFTWAIRNKVRRVVYLSSSAAYPIQLQSRTLAWPLREIDINLHDPGEPDALYGWIKLTGEQLASYAAAAGLSVLVLRPFSGYGIDQDETYPFPALLGRALRRETPFTVWGSGRQVRDWIHVNDIVAGTFRLIEHGVTGPMNLCTGNGTTFDELATLMCKAAHHTAPVKHVREKPTGVEYRVGNPTRLTEHYTPQVSLEAAISAAVKAMV